MNILTKYVNDAKKKEIAQELITSFIKDLNNMNTEDTLFFYDFARKIRDDLYKYEKLENKLYNERKVDEGFLSTFIDKTMYDELLTIQFDKKDLWQIPSLTKPARTISPRVTYTTTATTLNTPSVYVESRD